MAPGQGKTGTWLGPRAVFDVTEHTDVVPPKKGHLYFKQDGQWYTKIAETETRLATLADIDAMDVDIDSLQDDVADHETRLDTLEADFTWTAITMADPAKWIHWADTNYSPAVYGKDPLGFVHCEGLIGGVGAAAVGDLIWTFPAGQRPRKNLFFSCMASSGIYSWGAAAAVGTTSMGTSTSTVTQTGASDPNITSNSGSGNTSTVSSHAHDRQNHQHGLQNHDHPMNHSHFAVSHDHTLSIALGYHAVLVGVYANGEVKCLGSGWNPVGGWLGVNFSFFAA